MSTTTELTQTQREYLAFIRRFIANNGFSPSTREIADAFGVQVNAVTGFLKALEKKGRITRVPNMARTIRVVDMP